ncbi:AGE family epimerase/isomerase [Sphingobacterium chungjuense]|uniref:AGE family epimerase/isomerase n=1 Tax=Sphingobacterium chungjuense TaxID=2675553 RepID=UPI00140B1DCD|nr:AGE family epimerase/isomerase [Sphingobacterium chungjuense]
MKFIEEIEQELYRILAYWETQAVDDRHGGFLGRRDQSDAIVPFMPKGSVLNSRILWTFSAAYAYTNNPLHYDLAQRAYRYIKTFFFDKEFGGIYWSVDYRGQPLDTKKQTYALSFALYGFSEYYKINNDEEVLELCVQLFNTIEQHSFDRDNSGYFEAFSRDWQEIDDLRLSEKDANEKKTMNTHLHVIEAYTNLYRIWQNADLKSQIKNLLGDFQNHIIDPDSGHLKLFMNERWESKDMIYSYGHDIEASWLLLEAAQVIRDKELITSFEKVAINLAEAARDGIDEYGAVMYENNLSKSHFVQEKHWWVQAEALVGFVNAWEVSQQHKYLDIAQRVWTFTHSYIIDYEHGEWHWGRDAALNIMAGEDKVGFWKCPYHNARACMEVLQRMKKG